MVEDETSEVIVIQDEPPREKPRAQKSENESNRGAPKGTQKFSLELIREVVKPAADLGELEARLELASGPGCQHPFNSGKECELFTRSLCALTGTNCRFSLDKKIANAAALFPYEKLADGKFKNIYTGEIKVPEKASFDARRKPRLAIGDGRPDTKNSKRLAACCACHVSPEDPRTIPCTFFLEFRHAKSKSDVWHIHRYEPHSCTSENPKASSAFKKGQEDYVNKKIDEDHTKLEEMKTAKEQRTSTREKPSDGEEDIMEALSRTPNDPILWGKMRQKHEKTYVLGRYPCPYDVSMLTAIFAAYAVDEADERLDEAGVTEKKKTVRYNWQYIRQVLEPFLYDKLSDRHYARIAGSYRRLYGDSTMEDPVPVTSAITTTSVAAVAPVVTPVLTECLIDAGDEDDGRHLASVQITNDDDDQDSGRKAIKRSPHLLKKQPLKKQRK